MPVFNTGPASMALGGARLGAPGAPQMSDDEQRAMLASVMAQHAPTASPYAPVGMAVAGGPPRPMPPPVPDPDTLRANQAAQAMAQRAVMAPTPMAAPNPQAAAQAASQAAFNRPAAPPVGVASAAPARPMGMLGQAVARGRNMTPGAPRGPRPGAGVGGPGPAI